MRIITGIFKGRILKSPDSKKIRPTSDRAKETLFNILSTRYDFDGLTVLDLFCGTGSLGIESISRGAEKCYFVDEDISLVKKNIEALSIETKSETAKSDVILFLKKFDSKNVDMVFCDPPYIFAGYDQLIELVSEMKTVFVLEHSKDFLLNDRFTKYVF